MEHAYVPNYTINHKYALFYLTTTTIVYINSAQAILVRVIYSETNILINFDALHSIQFEPKWDNQQLMFPFLSYAFFKNWFKKHLVTVLHRFFKEKWEIQQ